MDEVREIESQEMHFLEAMFRVTFQNAPSRLNSGESLVSQTFSFGNISWNIRLQMDPRCPIRGGILCILNCLETKPGFSCEVYCKLSFLRASGQHSEREATVTFNDLNRSQDFAFLPLHKLSTINLQGLICHGALALEVNLKKDLPGTFLQQDSVIQTLQPLTINALIKDMDVLFESGDGDVTFKLMDGAIIKANKAILSGRNEVFATMLSVDMKEAKTNEVILEDIGKDAFKVLLLHIYTGQLRLPGGIDVDSCKEVVNGAEKYNLPELKEVAGMTLTGFVDTTNALQLFAFCRDRNVKEATNVLDKYARNHIDEIFEKLKF